MAACLPLCVKLDANVIKMEPTWIGNGAQTKLRWAAGAHTHVHPNPSMSTWPFWMQDIETWVPISRTSCRASIQTRQWIVGFARGTRTAALRSGGIWDSRPTSITFGTTSRSFKLMLEARNQHMSTCDGLRASGGGAAMPWMKEHRRRLVYMAGDLGRGPRSHTPFSRGGRAQMGPSEVFVKLTFAQWGRNLGQMWANEAQVRPRWGLMTPKRSPNGAQWDPSGGLNGPQMHSKID